MSRSKRHRPIIGNTTSESEKKDKRLYNRRWRRITKQMAKQGKIEEAPTIVDEVQNKWNMDKDGKSRFDPKKYPKYMRK